MKQKLAKTYELCLIQFLQVPEIFKQMSVILVHQKAFCLEKKQTYPKNTGKHHLQKSENSINFYFPFSIFLVPLALVFLYDLTPVRTCSNSAESYLLQALKWILFKYGTRVTFFCIISYPDYHIS